MNTTRTLIIASLLLDIAVLFSAADAQQLQNNASPATAASTAALPVSTSFQCDIAWNPACLALGNEEIEQIAGDIRSMVLNNAGNKQAKARLDVTFAQIPVAQVEISGLQPASMPANIEGWKAGRFFVFYSVLPNNDSKQPSTRELVQYANSLPDMVVGVLDEQLRSRDQTNPAVYEPYWQQLSAVTSKVQKSNDEIAEFAKNSGMLKMDVYAKQKRLEAVGRAIADLKLQAQDRIADDSLVKELQEVLNLRRMALEKTQKAAEERKGKGISSEEEIENQVRDAQMKLVEAKVQLAQRREAVASTATGELLARLAGEQANIEIDLAEIQAKMTYIQEQKQAAEQLDQQTKQLQEQLEGAKPYRISWRLTKDSATQPVGGP